MLVVGICAGGVATGGGGVEVWDVMWPVIRAPPVTSPTSGVM